MGTEVKLKREAIERRIAELEGKMPDIQASKEGAEARATIRRLKARLKTYPQEPKKRIYKVKARFIFDGVFEIRAHTRKEAVQMAKIGCDSKNVCVFSNRTERSSSNGMSSRYPPRGSSRSSDKSPYSDIRPAKAAKRYGCVS